MNEATFPGGPGLACSDAFQQTGRMEACGRLEGWKHTSTKPTRLLPTSILTTPQASPSRLADVPVVEQNLFCWQRRAFKLLDSWNKNMQAQYLCPSLACCWCLSATLVGRMATVPRFSGAEGPRAPLSTMYRYLTGAEMGCAPCSAVARVAPALSNPLLTLPTLHHQPRL